MLERHVPSCYHGSNPGVNQRPPGLWAQECLGGAWEHPWRPAGPPGEPRQYGATLLQWKRTVIGARAAGLGSLAGMAQCATGRVSTPAAGGRPDLTQAAVPDKEPLDNDGQCPDPDIVRALAR